MARLNLGIAFNPSDPTDQPSRPTGGSRVTQLDAVQFVDMLNKGQVRIFGLVCKDVDMPSTEPEAPDCTTAYVASDNCVIMYLGGTAYRICV